MNVILLKTVGFSTFKNSPRVRVTYHALESYSHDIINTLSGDNFSVIAAYSYISPKICPDCKIDIIYHDHFFAINDEPIRSYGDMAFPVCWNCDWYPDITDFSITMGEIL